MPHSNEYPRAQFILGELTLDIETRRRGDEAYGSVAKRDLERYYELLRRSLPAFTEAEASVLVDACDEWRIEAHSASLLWAKVDEAIAANGLDQQRSVDGPALVARLRSLAPFEALAVCDAIERFRLDPNPTVTALVRVGLVR